MNNISPEIEKQLNIGIFQFDDYIAFYINLTAYEQYLESQGSMNLIRISDSQILPDVKDSLLIPSKSVNRQDRIRYIEISVGRTYTDDDTGKFATDSGTHLIVFPYETQCGGCRFTSDPLIINYYRQFFMRLDEKVIDAKDDFLLCIIHVRK